MDMNRFNEPYGRQEGQQRGGRAWEGRGGEFDQGWDYMGRERAGRSGRGEQFGRGEEYGRGERFGRGEDFGRERGDWYSDRDYEGRGLRSSEDMSQQQGLGWGGLRREGFQDRDFGRERGSWLGNLAERFGSAYDERMGARGGYGGAYDERLGTRGGAYGGSYDYRSQGYMTPGQSMLGRFIGRGPKGYRRSDERIREDVCEMLTRHPEIDASDVEVDVRDHVVSLRGSVPERRMKRMAEDIIENLSGVDDVNNEIKVKSEGGMLSKMAESVGLGGESERAGAKSTTSGTTTTKSSRS
jgi:hypothetical protein